MTPLHSWLVALAAADEVAVEKEPSFQPYIFWAYGLACLLLLAFTLWTVRQTKGVRQRLDYLDDRFKHAHPDVSDGESGSP